MSRAPHALAHYLRELANTLHSYYNAEQFIVEDAALRNARLALVLGVQQVLRNGLACSGCPPRRPCEVHRCAATHSSAPDGQAHQSRLQEQPEPPAWTCGATASSPAERQSGRASPASPSCTWARSCTRRPSRRHPPPRPAPAARAGADGRRVDRACREATTSTGAAEPRSVVLPEKEKEKDQGPQARRARGRQGRAAGHLCPAGRCLALRVGVERCAGPAAQDGRGCQGAARRASMRTCGTGCASDRSATSMS